jgi:hypothetical protein
MENKQLYKERMMILVSHLFHGVLLHPNFSMACWNRNGTAEHPCGTHGCAIGECPAVFDEWYANLKTRKDYGKKE